MGMNLTIKLKGQNSLSIMEGGPFTIEILFLKDKDQSYMLDRKNRTFTKVGKKPTDKPADPPKVTKTTESAKILNYTCFKFLVETTEYNRTANQVIWATTEIKDIDWKSLAKQGMGRGRDNTVFFEGVEGFPLRVEGSIKEGNTTMEVIEIKKENLSAADFTVPSDFKEDQGIFSK